MSCSELIDVLHAKMRPEACTAAASHIPIFQLLVPMVGILPFINSLILENALVERKMGTKMEAAGLLLTPGGLGLECNSALVIVMFRET